jgi:hypothetical protein
MAQGGPQKEYQMNKPSKSEFTETVNDYMNAGFGEVADIFEIVDNWTHYYKSKFWSAVYQARSN